MNDHDVSKGIQWNSLQSTCKRSVKLSTFVRPVLDLLLKFEETELFHLSMDALRTGESVELVETAMGTPTAVNPKNHESVQNIANSIGFFRAGLYRRPRARVRASSRCIYRPLCRVRQFIPYREEAYCSLWSILVGAIGVQLANYFATKLLRIWIWTWNGAVI